VKSIARSARHKACGFSLVELTIAVVVVVILAIISLPSYAEYVRRGTRTEAQAFLIEVAQRQQRRLVERSGYAATIADLGLALPNSLSGKYTLSMSVPAVVPPAFTISAVPQGPQAAEGCGTLTVTSEGQRQPARCWH
jgi:type IV pilus assembly protein PilE